MSVRTAAAFVLTWINPFFAVFAFVAYFDAEVFLRRRAALVVFVVTAVGVGGSQSGGLPPRSGWQAVAFVGLVVLNLGLFLFFEKLERQRERLMVERASTIAELEESNRRLADALAENAALQDEVVERAREAGVHDERERMALEIHDTIAQSLAGIVTQLEAAAQSAGAAADQRRERAVHLAREALGEARRSVQGLLPHRLDDALLAGALERLVAEWSEVHGVVADFTVDGVPTACHRDVETTVLRVAQEALTNVARHADAGRVGVSVAYQSTLIALDVRDDGVGFEPAAVQVRPPEEDGPAKGVARRGVGLTGMRQRAARVAGQLVVESSPGRGTAVSLHVPIVPTSAETVRS